jgi:hypothetical protein
MEIPIVERGKKGAKIIARERLTRMERSGEIPTLLQNIYVRNN